MDLSPDPGDKSQQLPGSQYEVCDPGSEGGKRGMRNIPNDT